MSDNFKNKRKDENFVTKSKYKRQTFDDIHMFICIKKIQR